MAAAKPGSSAPCHRIDLINEDDTGRVLLGLLKQIADTRCADADEHLDKIRPGDGEERHAGFPCNRLGQQRLAGARLSLEQNALRNSCTDRRVLPRILEKIHDLLELLLLLLESGHVRKRMLALQIVPLRIALAKIHHPGIGAVRAVLPRHQEKEEKADHRDQQDRQNVRQEPVLLRYIPHHRIKTGLSGLVLQLVHIRRIKGLHAVVAQRDTHRTRGRLPVRNDHDALHRSLVKRLLVLSPCVGRSVGCHRSPDILHEHQERKENDQPHPEITVAASLIFVHIVPLSAFIPGSFTNLHSRLSYSTRLPCRRISAVPVSLSAAGSRSTSIPLRLTPSPPRR